MADRSFSLIDVMLAIERHSLITRLSEQAFTFLIGLVMRANDQDFTNPIELSNSQAMAVGGGNNRQSVHRRRGSLCAFKINGKPFLKVKPGDKLRNNVASYIFDYDTLLSRVASQICNTTCDVNADLRHTDVTERVTKDLDQKEEIRKRSLNTIPYAKLKPAKYTTDLSYNQRERLDTFGHANIAAIDEMYYCSSTDDTVTLFNLLRTKTPGEVLELVEKAKQNGIKEDALLWIERGCPDE